VPNSFEFLWYFIQHCFICRPSDSTVWRMLGLNPGLVRLRHWQSDGLSLSRLDLIPFTARSHPRAARSHPKFTLFDFYYGVCQKNGFVDSTKSNFPGATARQWKRRPLKVVVFNLVVSRQNSQQRDNSEPHSHARHLQNIC
jgi:hypothetical protein